jgi:hypothetical protein
MGTLFASQLCAPSRTSRTPTLRVEPLRAYRAAGGCETPAVAGGPTGAPYKGRADLEAGPYLS